MCVLRSKGGRQRDQLVKETQDKKERYLCNKCPVGEKRCFPTLHPQGLGVCVEQAEAGKGQGRAGR